MRKRVITALLVLVVFVAGYWAGYSRNVDVFRKTADWSNITQADMAKRRMDDIRESRVIANIECIKWKNCEPAKEMSK